MSETSISELSEDAEPQMVYEYPIPADRIMRDFQSAKDKWRASAKTQADIDQANKDFDDKYKQLFREFADYGEVIRELPDGELLEIIDMYGERYLSNYFDWVANLDRHVRFAEGSGRERGRYGNFPDFLIFR